MKACVVVFGREPIPGEVKSRLAAGIGANAAAQVYGALLVPPLGVGRGSGARVVVSLAELPSGSWSLDQDVVVEVQRGDDLGERMADAFTRRFAEGERRVVIVGSDCPWLRGTHIAKASAKLGGADVLLGPATDGGYWLVAQRPPGLAIFSDIPWSSPETLGDTRKRIRALGGTWLELEELVDIDTVDDLELVLSDPRTPETLRLRLLDALSR
mgnify:CR=1 FL=1